MRCLLVLLPALVLAQTAPPKPTATKPSTTQPAAAKPASAKPAAAKPAAAKPAAAAPKATPLTEDQKGIYALGLSVHRSLEQFELTPEELQIVIRAINDAQAGKPEVNLQEVGPKIQELQMSRSSRAADREKVASQAFLAKAAAEPGAQKTESGLIYRELTPGTGASPKSTDTVKVHYRGTLPSGKEFDSSYSRNEPAEFPLNQVIPCWTEGVQKMKVGGKAVLVCPSGIAYGDRGRPPVIPGGATLIFEIELLDIPGAK